MHTNLRFLNLLFAALALSACVESEERVPDSADLRDPWVIPAIPRNSTHEAGRQVFASCASCHLADAGGRPDGTIPRLAGQQTIILERRLQALRDGSRDLPVMTPFARALTNVETHQVAAYLSSLPRPQYVGLGPGTELERGASIYRQLCQSCHGTDARGQPELNAPRLCGQHEPYMERRLREMTDPSLSPVDAAMRAIAAVLSPADRRAVSDYLARLRCD